MKKLFLIIGIFVILLLYGCGIEKNNFGALGSAHIHAGIKVYILGSPTDFSLPKYQLQDKITHFEDNNGDVVHIHANGVTLGYIFKTLGMRIDNECLTLDTGDKHCGTGNAKLKVFVKNADSDWEQISYPADYVIHDLDKILVNYGIEDEKGIEKNMESVANKAAAMVRDKE